MESKQKQTEPSSKGNEETDCYRIEPDLSDWIMTERNYTTARWIYEQYRAELIPEIKPLWIKNRKLKNKWAQKWGLKVASENWVANYEMSLENYEKELDRVLDEIKPLYRKMHSYLRHKLGEYYATDKVGQLPVNRISRNSFCNRKT